MTRHHARQSSAHRESIRSSSSTRSSRPVLIAFLILTVVGAPSTAAACPVTDPTCVVKEVKDTATETVDDVEETLKDTADKAVEDVNETVEGTEETVSEVEKDVNEVLDPGNGSDPPAPPNPSPPGPGNRKDGEKDDDVRGGSEEPGDDAGTADDRRSGALGPAPTDPPDNPPVAPSTPASAERSGPGEGIAESALEAAKTFAFPLFMTLLVGIYLIIQHRVDRRDPKFVLAPLEQELLSFE